MHHRTRNSAAGAIALALMVRAAPIRAEDIVIPKAAAYCEDLVRITDVAATKKNFAVIAGKPREGDSRDTTLPLAGWKDCSLYGNRTYTCDSPGFGTATAAEKALTGLVTDIMACLGEGWAADSSRSSPDYLVVHDDPNALSMTLSTDAKNPNEHVVRLILFLRGK